MSLIMRIAAKTDRELGSGAVVSTPEQVKGCRFDSSWGYSLWCLHLLDSSHVPEI